MEHYDYNYGQLQVKNTSLAWSMLSVFYNMVERKPDC